MVHSYFSILQIFAQTMNIESLSFQRKHLAVFIFNGKNSGFQGNLEFGKTVHTSITVSIRAAEYLKTFVMRLVELLSYVNF